jgi:tetratricopeptide (TPR) repeat protein
MQMRIRRGLFLALAAATAIGACAPAATNGVPGAPRPAETQYTRAAKLSLAQAEATSGEQQREFYQQVLQQSLQGIEAAPNNPQHFYLAGLGHAGLDNLEAADTMFNRAVEMFPPYEDEVMAAREQVWMQTYDQGIVAFQAGDMQTAARHWERANLIYDRRPEAYFNLAAVHAQQEQYDRALRAFEAAVRTLDREPGRELSAEEQELRITALENLGSMQMVTEQFADAERTFRRLVEMQPQNVQARSNLALALTRQGRRDAAQEVYQELLAMPDLSGEDMMAIGVGLFQAEEYGSAADAFRRITTLEPNNRDAWYNLLSALFRQERWQDAIPVAERLLELDPLNDTAHLILIQAFRETRQPPRTLEIAERRQALPVFVDNVQLRHEQDRAVLRAEATGNRARAGSPVRLQFTLYGPGNQTLGTETVTVTAPAQNATTNFEASIGTVVAPTGFSYRVLQ